jgi:hypothetical protein
MMLPEACLPASVARTVASRRRTLVAVIIGWMLSIGISYGQSYIFESPNTREHMSDEAALQSLDSLEQRNFVAVAGYLARRLCHEPKVAGGLGMFAGSTENTAMVSGCKGRRARYLGELLARYAHQEWVLIFTADPRGNERLVVISFAGDQLKNIPLEMRKSGLNTGTILGEGNMVRVYLWATDHSLDAMVQSFADAHQGKVQEIVGKGTLAGSDSRLEAQHVFDREIAAYERRHNVKLSALLWTRKLHDLGLGETKSHH